MKKIKYLLFCIPIFVLSSCNNKIVKVDSIRNVSYDSFTISNENRDNALKSCVSLSDNKSSYYFSGVVIDESLLYYYIATYGAELTSGYIKLSKATLYDYTTVNATYVGTDSKNNIAVYKILKTKELSVAEGYTEELVKGTNVMSVSTPLSSDDNTVNTIKTGVLSNTSLGIFGTSCELTYAELGSAIFNTDGKLLGITTSVVSTSQTAQSLDELIYYHVTGLNQSTTYSLLYDISKDIIDADSDIKRGLMGVTVTNYEIASISYSDIINESDVPYVTIIAVSENSSAALANIKAGYYITKIDGNSVSRLTDLNYYMARKNKGDIVKLSCLNELSQEIEYRLILK